MDQSLSLLNQLHPHKDVRDAAIRAYNKAVKLTPKGVHPVITETYRSIKQSNNYYAIGRTVANPVGKSAKRPMGETVSNAKGGESYHNYRLALDMGIVVGGKYIWEVNKNWMIVVNCFLEEGFTWGADWDRDGKTKAQGDRDESFVDFPHFQKTLGYRWPALKDKYDKKDFIPGTEFINL